MISTFATGSGVLMALPSLVVGSTAGWRGGQAPVYLQLVSTIFGLHVPVQTFMNRRHQMRAVPTDGMAESFGVSPSVSGLTVM